MGMLPFSSMSGILRYSNGSPLSFLSTFLAYHNEPQWRLIIDPLTRYRQNESQADERIGFSDERRKKF